MKTSEPPVLIGLHITKCAGTTLAEHVAKNLPPQCWYLCSSPYNMEIKARQELAERLSLETIRFVFGHYVHESLCSVFAGRQTLWFTGIREPIERAVSEYYQICKVRALSSEKPISADEYLRLRSDTMCRELLRAFPTINSKTSGDLLERACQAAEMFDLIYESAQFETSIAPLLKQIGISSKHLVTANTRFASEKDIVYLKDQETLIRHASQSHFAADLQLYNMLHPLSGRWKPFSENSEAMERREKWTKCMVETQEIGLMQFSSHMSHYYVRDFANVGHKEDLAILISRRQAWIDSVKSALRDI